GVLDRSPMFDRLSPTGVSWNDGREHECDAIIWCTGFRPHLGHLSGLGLTRENGHPATDGTRSIDHPGLQLLGYGDWTGFASATPPPPAARLAPPSPPSPRSALGWLGLNADVGRIDGADDIDVYRCVA